MEPAAIQLFEEDNRAEAAQGEEQEQEQDMMCPICLDVLSCEFFVTGCGHSFHNECLEKYVQRCEGTELSCPMCKRVVCKTVPCKGRAKGGGGAQSRRSVEWEPLSMLWAGEASSLVPPTNDGSHGVFCMVFLCCQMMRVIFGGGNSAAE
jgi:hypothetical protein